MHELEMVNGEAQMAWSGDVPWHGLGKQVPADLTPAQMLEAAGLNWRVEKRPMYYEVNGKMVRTSSEALVRDSDDSILSVVSGSWVPCQNEEAFEFFNDFIAAGDMEMHTAGSIKNGQNVWALAKIKESFELFDGDTVEGYLLFSNPHQFGKTITVQFTPIRVVCNNTLTLSLSGKNKSTVNVNHRKAFNGDEVKEMMGIASEKLAQYKEMAAYLGQKRFKDEDVVDYFKRIFPIAGGNKKNKEMSRNAELAHTLLEEQPGAEFAPGSWWQAFNSVTYITNHLQGRSADNRLQSLWFGSNKEKNIEALELALEMAG